MSETLESIISKFAIDGTNKIFDDWVYDNQIMKLKIKFINKSNNEDPKYTKEGDSGFDLRAFINEDLVLQPGCRVLVPTGLYIQIPNGFEIQVRSRSGLAIKNGIMVLNSPGTVDANYRGEICVILYNSDKNNSFTIKNGDRIAQAVVAPVQSLVNTVFFKTDNLDSTDRGEKGFGSSGV